MDKEQRTLITKEALHIANLIAAAMIVGMAVSTQQVSTTVLVLGILTISALYAFAYVLSSNTGTKGQK
jgi:dolichyl-phosphate-mannose--protein O-mannosyl transferase